MKIEERKDAAVVHRLTQVAFAEYGRELGTSTALKETVEAVQAQLADGNRVLVASVGGEPVACVRFRFEGDALYFHRLSVDPAYRRKGIAVALVEELERLARGGKLSRLTCSVRLAQAGNLALYERLGLETVGVRSVCRDGTPVPTGDLEKNLSPTPLPDARSSLGKGQSKPTGIVKGQRVTEEKVIRAREFRKNPTNAEAMLWERLRANRLAGLKFRRQQIIAGFIVDFYCHAAALAVELDGSVHDDPGRDAHRDAIIAGHGIDTLRISNDDVILALDEALERILERANARISPPSTVRNERPGEGAGGEVNHD